MAEIKSAYERAMERFQDVEPDRGALKKDEFIAKGKIICAKKLQGETVDILQELGTISDNDKRYFYQGIGETLVAQINLPANEFDIQKIEIISTIAESISSQPDTIQNLLQQFTGLCKEYLENKTELTEQLKAHYMQLMQQQQAQGGRMDPSMLQGMQEQMKQLDDHFLPSVEEVKKTLSVLLGLETEG